MSIFADRYGLREWFVLTLIVGGVVLFAVVMVLVESHSLTTTPCSEYSNSPARNVPFRCFKEMGK